MVGSGQICMNIKRIYVHDKIYDEFLAAMIEFVRNNMPYGSTSDANTALGPVQNSMQYGKVKNLFEEAEKQKWTIALGGLKELGDKLEAQKGLILPPTIIDNPPESSRIVTEEPFGPILPVMRWTDEADVISRANAFEQALGASVWSSDVAKATKIADQLESGSVWVNSHFQVTANMPFGGHKASGIGMDWGIIGLKGWCNPQGFWIIKG